MRIMHFLNHHRPLNGHVHVAVDLACIQSKMGHQVCLVSGDGEFEALLKSYNVEYIPIDLTRRPLNLIRALYKLRLAVTSFRPDIIHAHMVTCAVLAYMLRPFMKFKLVNTVHNEFEKSAIGMALGDRVIAVSKAVASSMERRGVAKKKLRVVLNGTIGSPRLSMPPPPKKDLNHPAILFVGGLHPRKGVDDLIAAFKIVAEKVPSAFLYIVGTGPYEQAYREQAAQTGFRNRIEFCGGQADPRPYFSGADLFVLPSHAEPAGLVLSEAREAGCAIISTAVDGVPEMLDDGQAGLLVPPGRPDRLAEVIIQVLTDPVLLTDLRARSLKNIDYFKIERVVRDYLSNYEELLAPHGTVG